MSALFAIASPRRIKAAHRPRRMRTTGHSVYANNNPYKFVDPDGRFAWFIPIAIYAVGALTHSAPANAPATSEEAISDSPGDVLSAGLPPGKALGALKTINGIAGRVSKHGGNIRENAEKGKAGEAATREKLGNDIAGEQVTFKTSDGTRTRADFVTNQGNVVETKTGGARLSSGQEKLQSDISSGRQVTPVGKNATNAGLPAGQPATMKSCTVDRPEC